MGGPWQDGRLEEKQLPTTTWGLEGSTVGDRTGEQWWSVSFVKGEGLP